VEREHGEKQVPEATQIVDLYHAREHLHDLARLLEFMLLDRKDEWLAARLEDLDYGDIDGICNAARAYPLTGVKKDELDTAWATSRTTRPACATTCSVPAARSSAPAQLSPAARRSSGSVSSSLACIGPSPAPMPSLRSAASRPAGPNTTSGQQHATRPEWPDQPNPLNDLSHLQNWRAPTMTAGCAHRSRLTARPADWLYMLAAVAGLAADSTDQAPAKAARYPARHRNA